MLPEDRRTLTRFLFVVKSVRSLGDPGNFWVAFPVCGRTKSALPGDAPGVSVILVGAH